MNVTKEDVVEITRSVWSAVLGLEGDMGAIPECGSEALPGLVVTGCVTFAGGWDGAVTVQCSKTAASVATVTMLGLESTEPSAEDIRDAVGELANMVGGNVKALLPGPTQLSLPIVFEGPCEALTICDVEPVHTICMTAGGQSFVVALLRRPPGAGARPREHGSGRHVARGKLA